MKRISHFLIFTGHHWLTGQVASLPDGNWAPYTQINMGPRDVYAREKEREKLFSYKISRAFSKASKQNNRIDGTFRKPSVSYLKPTLIEPYSTQEPTNSSHGPFVTYLYKFGLYSHDRCVCGAEGDPNHYATVCPVTKLFHFTKPSAGNLLLWCENIVQVKRSLARLMNIMKILHERRQDIIMD
ncbi:hypothetical protein AVEN_34590-1 [Araneus ventricosus]|uniref:Uncharacterized protein n=1 Tax=Araneus ventricosus TaxID=182803 RepID=A0A4Y2B057_ARAVE|nr:hypothetical protein AVEN_34590-1 [Araneus ventricosus]